MSKKLTPQEINAVVRKARNKLIEEVIQKANSDPKIKQLLDKIDSDSKECKKLREKSWKIKENCEDNECLQVAKLLNVDEPNIGYGQLFDFQTDSTIEERLKWFLEYKFDDGSLNRLSPVLQKIKDDLIIKSSDSEFDINKFLKSI
jgi:hypothetical protein